MDVVSSWVLKGLAGAVLATLMTASAQCNNRKDEHHKT